MLGCLNLNINVMEEVLEFTNDLMEDTLGNSSLHSRGKLLVKIVLFEIESSWVIDRLLNVILGMIKDLLVQMFSFDLIIDLIQIVIHFVDFLLTNLPNIE